MAWVAIPNNPDWEYDNAATNAGGVAGIRTNSNGTEVYVKCRQTGFDFTGYANQDQGEIAKTYWDNQ